MRAYHITTLPAGMALARPAIDATGREVAGAGTPLDGSVVDRIGAAGIETIWALPLGARRSAAVPDYIDRFGPDFPTRLQSVFAEVADRPLMQDLFAAALRHADRCYRRYRLGEDHDD